MGILEVQHGQAVSLVVAYFYERVFHSIPPWNIRGETGGKRRINACPEIRRLAAKIISSSVHSLRRHVAYTQRDPASYSGLAPPMRPYTDFEVRRECLGVLLLP